VIESAWRAGARFDLWDECFDRARWEQAFAEHGWDVYALAQHTFADTEILPWSHLGGPEPGSLAGHFADAMAICSSGNGSGQNP
jgi:hypothetical protein